MKLTGDYAAGNTDADKRRVDERYRLWLLKNSLFASNKSGATVRVISLRRAHKTEVKRYEEKA